MNLLREIKEFQEANLRERLVAYCTNKDIPLRDRWEVFTNTPTELQNHKKFSIYEIVVFSGIPNQINWLSCGIDVQKISTTGQLIECLERDFCIHMEYGFNKEILTRLKEDFLQSNKWFITHEFVL